MNDLRSRIVVQTDGKLQTGRDVSHRRAAGRRRVRLLHGAAGHHGLHHDAQVPSEHLPGRHCDAGSRRCASKFAGKPENVINYFFFIAEEVREIMAQLGFRTLDEMIGRVDMLEMRERGRSLEGAAGSIFRAILYNPAGARSASAGAA